MEIINARFRLVLLNWFFLKKMNRSAAMLNFFDSTKSKITAPNSDTY